MGWWVVNSTPQPLYSREGDTVPFGQEVGWDQGQSVGLQKILPPPGFSAQDIQP
jgi:hypothetical protein